MTKTLDIGGGEAKPEMATIDINPLSEIVHDLNVYPWPIGENSYNRLRMFHVLEHLENPLAVMREVYRIAKPRAVLEIKVPWWERDMFSNPAHLHWFKPKWFHRLHPGDSAWAGEMKSQCRMDWNIILEKKVRGEHAFWRTYEYHVWLEAIK